MLKRILARAGRGLGATSAAHNKESAELRFWRHELARYEAWFRGDMAYLYKTPAPDEDARVLTVNSRLSSIRTWHKHHQEPKYLQDLGLSANAFDGLRLLDLGSGPMPSATCFVGAELYCLDPLLSAYLDIGFPLHTYGCTRFIQAYGEDIPVSDDFFDAVISVNSLDHVDDPEKTASEIRRVLRPGGRVRVHTHYHPPTACEPIQFSDESVAGLFEWCPGFHRLGTMRSNFSMDLPEGESFALWSNF